MQKAPVSNVQTLFCYLVTERSRGTRYKLVPYGQKSYKIESNRSNRVLCLICCCLLDFSRSDSFSAMNFRLLSAAEAPKCRIQIFHILAFVETSYHAVSENHSSFISSDSHCATLFSIYWAMPFISSQSRIIRS